VSSAPAALHAGCQRPSYLHKKWEAVFCSTEPRLPD